MDDPLLRIEGLKVWLHTDDGTVKAVDGIDLVLGEGETLGVVGESGSGKSVTAYSILRLLPEGIVDSRSGSIKYRGKGGVVDLLRLPIQAMPGYRGGEIAMVFQEPMTSLNPVITCGYQLSEAWTAHHVGTFEDGWRAGKQLLEEVGISQAARRMRQYPHELSGGMKQRVMIAMALACNPRVLICDEPTTALDVTIQKQILGLIADLQKARRMAVLYISHDLAVVAEIADHVAVMCPGETLRLLGQDGADRGGHVVEYGTVRQIFEQPQHPYTRALIACRPQLTTAARRLPTIEDFAAGRVEAEAAREQPPLVAGPPLLEGRGLRTWFPVRGGLFSKTVNWVKAVDGVDVAIPRGRTLGLVGESGCGKTTLGRTLLQLIRPMEGRIVYDGRDVTDVGRADLRALRRHMQIVFQDPYASLNPRHSVEEILTEPLREHHPKLTAAQRRERAVALLEQVGLRAAHLSRYPHEFSGGQRQRIGIARAIAVEPDLIVCDEAVSALDVSVQAGIINLLLDLQDEMGLTYLFISHDLSVVKFVSDEVAVMASDAIMADLYEGQDRAFLNARDRGGHIVEQGTPDDLYARPQHPYTRRLLEAIPSAQLERRIREVGPHEAS